MAATRSSRQRAVQVPPHCQWHMQASGTNSYVETQDLS